MRKLIESTFVTLDGVISSPQNWSPPYWNDEHDEHARKLLKDVDALLLGRLTYEVFAESWPLRAGDDFADQLNSLPKHVASTTLDEATWNASIIRGDVAEEVAKLKDQPGQSILKYGTGVLDRTLLEHRLIDELHLWIFPTVAGTGDRLLDGLDVTHLQLVDTTTFSTGIIVATYAPK